MRAPKALTKERVRKAALFHLQRHASTRVSLRRVLTRRVNRVLRVHEGDRDEMLQWVEDALDYCERLGYLDDARFATHKARALRRRGASTRKIRAKLAEKGVASSLVDQALEDEDGASELRSALRLVRRRRFGAWATGETDRRRELAALARAGFSYDLAKKALQMSLEDAEAVLAG
ncbi:MAG: regulatory protein RecX [Myxococcota bacterium]